MKLLQSLPLYGCVLLVSPVLAASTPVQSEVEQHLSNAQIVGIVMTVDKGEIAAANVAATKKISPMVKKYAMYLKKQHSKNLKKLMALDHKLHLKPAVSDISKTLREDGSKGLKELEALNGKAFESAYIDAMVKGHAGGLKVIKNRLLTSVTNMKLKHFLTSFQAMVKHHLKDAKKIQKKLAE